MSYIKPQTPLQHKDGDYFYPLTTIDQVIMEDGITRLNGADLISVNTDSAPEGETAGINADTLGGYAADAYVKKTDAMIVIKNYSVVGGMDEPSSPTENMIWVQTENVIGKVYFSSAEPSSVNNNDIWIYTSNGSNIAFDAIKIGNDTMNTIYLQNAKQYINGAFENVEVQIYQKGKWIVLETILMENGEVTNKFGDFGNPNKYIPFPTSGHNRCSFELDTSDQKATLSWTKSSSSNAYSASVAYFENKIDLTNINTIKIKAGETSTGSEDDFTFTASTTIGDNYSKDVSQNISANEEVNIDVSSLSGSYYLSITCYTRKTSAFIEILDWRMTP